MKWDGSLDSYDPEILHEDLRSVCDGLNMDFIKIEIIVEKVSMGLP